jgi:hypothetical protein
MSWDVLTGVNREKNTLKMPEERHRGKPQGFWVVIVLESHGLAKALFVFSINFTVFHNQIPQKYGLNIQSRRITVPAVYFPRLADRPEAYPTRMNLP